MKKTTIILTMIASLMMSSMAKAEVANQDNQPQSTDSVSKGGGRLIKIDDKVKGSLTLIGNNATGFYTGDKSDNAVPMIIFFDPECPYCKMLWEEVSSLKVQPRILWIPVGLLDGERSLNEAAYLIENKSDYKNIMEKLKNKTDLSKEKVSDESKNNILKNNLLFSTLKFSSVPIILKVTKDKFLYAQNGFLPLDDLNKVINY